MAAKQLIGWVSDLYAAIASVIEDGKVKTTATLVAEDIEIGAVELKNATTDDRAAIDTIGRLSVADDTKSCAGETVAAVNAGVEARQSLAALGDGYPMRVRVHARGCDFYVAQGTSLVALDATAANNELIEDGARIEYTVRDVSEAYFAHKPASGTGSIAFTRVDQGKGV